MTGWQPSRATGNPTRRMDNSCNAGRTSGAGVTGKKCITGSAAPESQRAPHLARRSATHGSEAGAPLKTPGRVCGPLVVAACGVVTVALLARPSARQAGQQCRDCGTRGETIGAAFWRAGEAIPTAAQMRHEQNGVIEPDLTQPHIRLRRGYALAANRRVFAAHLSLGCGDAAKARQAQAAPTPTPSNEGDGKVSLSLRTPRCGANLRRYTSKAARDCGERQMGSGTASCSRLNWKTRDGVAR